MHETSSTVPVEATPAELEEAEVARWTPLALRIANRYRYRLSRTRLVDLEDLRAVAMQGLLRGLRTCPRGSVELGAWLTVTIRRSVWQVFAHLARAKRNVLPGSIDALHDAEIQWEPGKSDVSLDEGIEDREFVAEALASLPEREAYVVRQIYLEEQTSEEVAAELRISEKRVCQIRQRAFAKLRQWCWAWDRRSEGSAAARDSAGTPARSRGASKSDRLGPASGTAQTR